MTPAYRFGFRITRHVAAGGRPRRRNAGAIPIMAVCAVLATVGAVAAGVAHRNNTERAAQYAADSSCRASPAMKPSSAAVDGRCTIEFATVTVRYVRTYRRSHSYRLGLQTPDGAVDSIEIKGPDDKVIWDASPVRSAIVVQRFTDRGPGKRHVTLVIANGLQARTAWNPAWQTMNTEIGMWFLGMASVLCVVALLWQCARRPRVAIPLSFALFALAPQVTPLRTQARPLPTARHHRTRPAISPDPFRTGVPRAIASACGFGASPPP